MRTHTLSIPLVFLGTLQILAAAGTSVSTGWERAKSTPELAAATTGNSWPDGIPYAVVGDPTGDTFGGGALQLDIIQLSATTNGSQLMVSVSFAGSISPGDSGNPDAVVGFIDLDTDQNTSTGVSNVGLFCPAPPMIGADFYVFLFAYDSATGMAELLDSTGALVGTVPVAFQSQSFGVDLPLSLLSDDGTVDVATVLGTFQEPTDCAPNGATLTSDGIPIPTLGEWGALLMGSLLLGLGAHTLWNRRLPSPR